MASKDQQFIIKRELLQAWLDQFSRNTINICKAGNKIDKNLVLNQIQTQYMTKDKHEWIYILTVKKDNNDIPLYIGKTNSPYNRWKSHIENIENIEKNKGLYKRWTQVLYNPNKTAIEDLYITLVPQSDISKPPIPGFPISIGAIEYQLISIASDVYPQYLLNKEGNRR